MGTQMAKIKSTIHTKIGVNTVRHPTSTLYLETATKELQAAAGDHVRTAVLARATRALVKIISRSSSHELAEAAAAATDIELFLGVLNGSLPSISEEGDAIKRARLRGIGAKRDLIESSGGCLSVSQVAGLLGVSRQAVDKRRRNGRIIGLSVGRRANLFPSWQFEEIGTLPHLQEVLDVLDQEQGDWGKVAFFVRPKRGLGGRTPVEALRAGDLHDVLRVARNYLKHGGD
jgi:hypothetical protein